MRTTAESQPESTQEEAPLVGNREEPPTLSTGQEPGPEPSAVVVELRGSISRLAIPSLCERAHALISGCDREAVICDVGGLVQPDVATLDALARLHLTAKRLGHAFHLRHASAELRDLIELAGLGEVLSVEPG